MAMNKEKIEKVIISLLKDFTSENNIELLEEISADTRLIGSKGILDSMDLVSFLVELEEVLSEDLNIDVELTSDSAMSARTSPFINISTLTSFIQEIQAI